MAGSGTPTAAPGRHRAVGGGVRHLPRMEPSGRHLRQHVPEGMDAPSSSGRPARQRPEPASRPAERRAHHRPRAVNCAAGGKSRGPCGGLAGPSVGRCLVRGAHADFERIEVPLLSAGNWGGLGLHLRGNIEGYLRAGSKRKWLSIHIGTHFESFYAPDYMALQRKFLDRYLKGIYNAGRTSPRCGSPSAGPTAPPRGPKTNGRWRAPSGPSFICPAICPAICPGAGAGSPRGRPRRRAERAIRPTDRASTSRAHRSSAIPSSPGR